MVYDKQSTFAALHCIKTQKDELRKIAINHDFQLSEHDIIYTHLLRTFGNIDETMVRNAIHNELGYRPDHYGSEWSGFIILCVFLLLVGLFYMASK